MGSPIIDFSLEPEIDFQIDFQPDVEEPSAFRRYWDLANKPLWEGPSRFGKYVANILDPVETREKSVLDDRMQDETLRRLRSFGAGTIEGTGDVLSSFTSPLSAVLTAVGLGEYGAIKKGLSAAAPLGRTRQALSAPYAIHGTQQAITGDTLPEKFAGVTEAAGGMLGVKIPITKPVVKPPITGQRALPAGTYYGGPTGGSGQVGPLGPINEAMLSGIEYVKAPDGTFVPAGKPTNTPANKFVDLGELRELNRQKDIFYTGHEQGGGSAMTIADRALMETPVQAGDTRLGFNPLARDPRPYPESIIPEVLRPRTVQSVTRRLAGDEFAKPVEPKKNVTFENEPKIDFKPEPLKKDLRGGTAAIEPGEPILPSAREINKSYQNNRIPIDNNTINAVPPVLKQPVANLIAEESKLPSPWRSIRSVLKDLSPELWRREVRSVQLARQYDADWVPQFENALNKLTRAEKENFGAFVEGSAPVPSDNVRAAVDIWRQVESAIGDEAAARGLRLYKGKEHVPFQKNTANYWPRIPKDRLAKEGLLERLMKKGMTRSEANRVITHYQNTGEIVIGPQHTRIGRSDVPYRLDADAGLAHIRAMSKRIAQHRELGPLDVEGRGLEGIADLIEGTKDPKLTLTLMQRLTGREPHSNPRLSRILDGLRKYTAMTKLQNFTIPNVILGQPVTALKASRHPVAAITEITNLFKRRYRQDLSKSGAWQNFNYALAEELKGRDIYFIGAGETFNRGISAAVGKAVAKEAFREAKANSANKKAIGELSELVLEDIPKLLKQTELTPDQLKMAAGRMAEITQGLNVPGNLPYWASNPVRGPLEFAAQLVWQLKKMGFQATKNTWDAIKADPVRNVPIWLALSQIAGELTGDTKTFLRGLWKGDPELEVASRGDWWLEGSGITPAAISEVSNISGVDPQTLARLLDNWTQAFFLGLPADLLMASSYGPAGLTDALLGPVASDIRKFVYNAGKLNTKQVGKDLIRMLPIPGSSGISETIFPPEE